MLVVVAFAINVLFDRPRRRPVTRAVAGGHHHILGRGARAMAAKGVVVHRLNAIENLGNMIGMALASLFLPFLPLLAKQILLNNFLSDVPAIGIRHRPRRPCGGGSAPSLEYCRRAPIHAHLRPDQFAVRRAHFCHPILANGCVGAAFSHCWLVESLLTELLAVLVVRTRLPCYRSRPGNLLMGLTATLVAVALGLPYQPGVAVFDFVLLQGNVMAAIVAIVGLYLLATEMAKRWFYRRLAP